MTDLTIELGRCTPKETVDRRLCYEVGKLRKGGFWANWKAGHDVSYIQVTLVAELGFKEVMTFRNDSFHHLDLGITIGRADDYRDVARKLDKVWPKWIDHRQRLEALDKLSNPDFHDLALAEIAERHLQGRPPYHVTKTPGDSSEENHEESKSDPIQAP